MNKSELIKYVNHGDIYRLSGPSNAVIRQKIMEILTGDKLPKSKCGVNLIQKTLFNISGVTGSCLARKEKALTEWLNHE